jgi:uncharacterized protein (DUF1501 family)
MGCSAAIAALAGSRLTHVAFANPENCSNKEILVVVFLRGAWDALNVVPPIAGPDRGYYEAARSSYLRYPASSALPLNAQFGLHPQMAPLYALYQQQKLAIIQACGMTVASRSHFDCMQYMELGTPGAKTTSTGWITRHLQTAPNLPDVIQLPALAAGASRPTSVLAYPDVIAMSRASSFRFNGSGSTFVGGQSYRYWQQQSLRQMYTGVSWLDAAGAETLDLIDLLVTKGIGSSTYTPSNGAVYPSGSLGDNLKLVAQMVKADVGLRVATVDFGGWDTHEYQGTIANGTSVPYMAGLLDQLARGLAALYQDLDGAGTANFTRRLTAVVMSEFGRRLRENASQGCDHGHGSAMLVLGGNVNGGQVYGQWPGLANAQLFDNADLQVTTDYRRVLSEIIVRRTGNPYWDTVFPGYTGYTPLGVVRGPDVLPPQAPAPPPPGLNNQTFLPIVANCPY